MTELHALLRFVLWALILLCPLPAWLLATLLVGRGPGSRFTRGALALGPTSLALLAWVAFLRLIEWLHPDLAGGPQAWLAHFLPQWPLLPQNVVLLMAGLDASFFLVFSVFGAIWVRQREHARPFRIPQGGLLGWSLLVAGIGSVFLAQRPYLLPENDLLLDLVAALPLACVGLAVWAQGGRDAPRELRVETPRLIETTLPAVDAPALWSAMGALAQKATALASIPGKADEQAATVPRFSAEAWRFARGQGSAPRALEDSARELGKAGQCCIIGSLPDPTERILLSSLLFLAVHSEGLICLVVTEDPLAARDRLRETIQASGLWRCGELVCGETELRLALEGRRMPAAAFLDIEELSSRGVRALWATTHEGACPWARTVGLVVLSKVDRGSPLQVTHRAMALQRLALALRAAEASWSVLATGIGGAGTRSLVERLFPGMPVRDVPLGARTNAPVQVWAADRRFVESPGAPWVRRALDPLVKAGLPVAVGDPTGAFDLGSVEVWSGKVHLERELSLNGAASACLLDEPGIVAAWRALPHRPPLPGGISHQALWSWNENPVMNFLARPGCLAGLERAGELPWPRPVVGFANRAMNRAHVLAALREGKQDVVSLTGVFGEAAVQDVLGESFKGGAFCVRSIPSREGLTRVPVAPSLPVEDDTIQSATVTDDLIELVDANGGRRITRVDRLVAATRFYPKRVFALGNKRYEVPLDTRGLMSRKLVVSTVSTSSPLTRPILEIRLRSSLLGLPAQDEHEIRTRGIHYKLATFELEIEEDVKGLRRGEGEEIRFEAVRASYPTRARALSLPEAAGLDPKVLFHLARSLRGVLLAHLLVSTEDLDTIVVGPGEIQNKASSPGILVVDRHIGGMGLCETLDATTVAALLRWVRAILSTCACKAGCARCTPPEVLAAGPVKAGVLGLMGS